MRDRVGKFLERSFPFHMFEDVGAIRDERRAREAYARNRQRRGALLSSANEWVMAGCVLLLMMRVAGFSSSGMAAALAQALCGTMFACSMCFAAVLAAGWGFLRFVRE